MKSLETSLEYPISHWFDYESNSDQHQRTFLDTLNQMRKAINMDLCSEYNLGYSNFTFELWIILHRTVCNVPLTNRKQYIRPLNRAFSTSFENLDEYKHEDNFEGILRMLTLLDVIQAIKRAKDFMNNNILNGYKSIEYAGYSCYHENPSLTVMESVERILTDCKIIK
jgi:hypothetical protein